MNALKPRAYSRASQILKKASNDIVSVRHTGGRPEFAPWTCHDCRNKENFIKRDFTRSFWTNSFRSNVLRDKPSFRGSRRLAGSNARSQNPEQPTNISEDLPSQEERKRSDVSKRFSSLMDQIQSNVFIAGQRLNDLTGYSGIEALKQNIENQGQLVQTSRQKLQEAKQTYSEAINLRSASQKEVNELLQRKTSWSPQDLERFTSLYRSDHANEQAEATAQEAMTKAERDAEEATAKLSASILARYHEEQIWSDKIRRMSTWGTWGLMGVNVLLFLIFQIGVEPWRRKRLVKGFEDKVIEALEKEGIASNVAVAALQQAHGTKTDSTEALKADESITAGSVAPVLVSEVVEIPATSTNPGEIAVEIHGITGFIETCKAYLQDLFSSRAVEVRRVDLTTATLEGAFVGIAVTAIISSILRS